ncbi:hypothetical protein [Lacrimispora brassicae]
MKIFRHTSDYYLKKIQEGQLTNQQVAEELKTTVDVVNIAFNEYCKEQNPFKKKSFEFKNATIQVAISIISTFLVLFTLFEMQAARNATYLPDISLGNTEVAIAWDENGLPINISDETKDIVSKMINEENTQLNILPQLKIYNIGVGTAKDITFTWNTEQNVKQFMNVLNSYDNIDISLEGNMVHIKTPAIEQGSWSPIKSQVDFMLNSTQEFNTLTFPLCYHELIKEMYIRTNEIPPIYLTISYFDVQGKAYNKTMQINAKLSFLTQNPDGSGFCVYSLISAKENSSMNNFSLLNISSDGLIAITSICAVIISIVSMAFTVIFSMFQLRHNKNSVKPISAIKFNDYENQIAVKIENVGTGPLTIKKLVFKSDSRESSTLISMIPEINQLWSTFTESVDGWTIPVGGKLILLELQPENDEIKTLIRGELSKITVLLEYSDIYNTKFQEKRSLDFFGRHSE